MFLLRSASSILIDLNKKQLFFQQPNRPTRTYSIAIGKASTPSPVGQWQIINKKILTEDSVYGSRWLGLNLSGYGIHGTNMPSAIGKAVSYLGVPNFARPCLEIGRCGGINRIPERVGRGGFVLFEALSRHG